MIIYLSLNITKIADKSEEIEKREFATAFESHELNANRKPEEEGSLGNHPNSTGVYTGAVRFSLGISDTPYPHFPKGEWR